MGGGHTTNWKWALHKLVARWFEFGFKTLEKLWKSTRRRWVTKQEEDEVSQEKMVCVDVFQQLSNI